MIILTHTRRQEDRNNQQSIDARGMMFVIMKNGKIVLLISSILLLVLINFLASFDFNQEDVVSMSDSQSDVMDNLPKPRFYPNAGQIANKDVYFYGLFRGGKIGFGESKVILWSDETNSDLLLTFETAGLVTPIGQHESKHSTNFFLGDRCTYTGIVSYEEILYKNVWSGIDVRFDMIAEGIKYEFIVSPYSDPGDIAILAEGQNQLEVGDISIIFGMNKGEFIDEGLIAHQGEIPIEAKFVLEDSNRIRLQIGEYDISKALIIDPLIYSTYLGGNRDEHPNDIVVDSLGNVYITGRTASANFPTFNPYDSTRNGDCDCFVSKFNANGSLVYSTFIGGSNDDEGESITIGPNGDLYVSGWTRSIDFPIMNAFNSSNSGEEDAFVLKLDPDGDTLLYSTYIGGPNPDYGGGIVIDNQGNMYVAGTAIGPGFPMVNSHDSSFNGERDLFICKLDSTGTILVYSTYIGGKDSDSFRSIALDSDGNLVILGQTESIDFPTLNAYDDNYQGIGTDCFLLKLNTTGTGLIFSTLVGGSHYDYPIGMDIDSSDNLYVTGQTGSGDFPTVNAIQATYSGNGDCFVFKLNSTGNGLEYSTYVGGWLDDEGFNIAVNDSGDVFVGARTRSSDFPTLNAIDRTHNGHYDFVVFQLDPTGEKLVYSTFVGGTDYEWSLVLATDDAGNVYLAGNTDSFDFPTLNAHDGSANGRGDCVVVKLYLSPSDGDADRLHDFLIASGITGTIAIIVIPLLIYRRRVKTFILSRVPTDPTKKARIAGLLFGVLTFLLPYGFSYRPDWQAPLSWTTREHSIAFGLFAIKSNVYGLGFEQLNYHLGIFLVAFIPFFLWFLRCASKIAKQDASFRGIVYTLIVFTVIVFAAFFPILGVEFGSIPIPIHLPVGILIARWGIPKELKEPFEDMEPVGKQDINQSYSVFLERSNSKFRSFLL